MSVLIKGMEMPTSCADCPLGDSLHCQVLPSVPALWAEYTNAIREKRLHSECPLVPVSPHGDLIDRDVAYDKIAEQEGGNYVDMDAVGMGLNETPVIIPAEEATQKDEGQDEAPAGPYDLLYEEGGYNSNGV